MCIYTELKNENRRRTDRKGLPQALDFWGNNAISSKPVGGEWAVTFSPIRSMDQPYNREDLTALGLFSEEDLEKTQPLMFGNERANSIANASIENNVPRWMKNSDEGWVTGEYGMLPRSTNERMGREAARGKQSGRTQEIQRLIGRSLAPFHYHLLPQLDIYHK